MLDLFKKNDDTVTGSTHEFKEYHFNPKEFIGYSVVWYGTTGSGKTYHFRYCLNEVKHRFARVILFSSTNSISKDFDGIINDVMIISDLTEQKFIECIQAQKKIADVYRNVVNNLDNLKKLFGKCANSEEQSQYNHIINERANKINFINSQNDEPSIKAQKIQELNATLDEKLILFFKYVIIPKRTEIDVSDLSPVEVECLRNIDVDPSTLIIFDDEQEELKELAKKKGECAVEFKNLFTKARHFFMTLWFTFQDDTALIPAARKSAKVSVFTDMNSLNGFITRNTNGIDKESQKLATELATGIFNDGPTKTHRKLIYFKEKSGLDRFQFSIAKNPGLFKVGSLAINNFCNSITGNI